MAKQDVQHLKQDDWCHRCGKRKDMHFVEFWLPTDADKEHRSGAGRYVRLCEHCIIRFAKMVVESV